MKAKSPTDRRILVTFLGRAHQDRDTGYQTAAYHFPDGVTRGTPFFGLALREHIQPEKMVILGTAGSMWDVLIEHLALTRGDRYEEQRLALAEAAESGTVDGAQLESLQPLAEESLGVPCELRLIGYGESIDRQMEILNQIQEAIGRSGQVHFDITHGLRHLSMLSLVACNFLEAMSPKLAVEHIWYGAFEMRNPGSEVPVLLLDGLTRLERWIGALKRFEDDGDYGIFTDLLIEEGMPADEAGLLRQAAFFEGVLNLPEARRRLNNFHDIIDRDGLPGAGSLFERPLRARIGWVKRDNLYEHQRRLAHLHLRKRDYLRTAILANEAILTSFLSQQGEGDVNDYRAREAARRELHAEMKNGPRDERLAAFKRLERIRNSLAHGTMPDSNDVKRLLRKPEQLYRELEATLSRFLS